jgi:hypothetical protein
MIRPKNLSILIQLIQNNQDFTINYNQIIFRNTEVILYYTIIEIFLNKI